LHLSTKMRGFVEFSMSTVLAWRVIGPCFWPEVR
jgi:hypothetical protein